MTSTKETKDSLFPIHIDDHGTEMTSINVGPDIYVREFKIHKAALLKASPYFASALDGNFKEAKDGSMSLDHDPIAFKVLYQYIYSGNVHAAAFYSKGEIPDDLLWPRTFKLADATMVHSLLHTTYDRLREEFSQNARTVPSLLFVDEHFETEYPQQDLGEYIATHAAYWILYDATGEWTEWVSLMEAVPGFALAVARQVAKRMSEKYRGSKKHPAADPVFDKDTLFPAPVVALPGKAKEEIAGAEMLQSLQGQSAARGGAQTTSLE